MGGLLIALTASVDGSVDRFVGPEGLDCLRIYILYLVGLVILMILRKRMPKC